MIRAGGPVAAVGLTVVMLCSGSFAAGSAPASPAGAAGLIAFSSDRDGNFEIYVMNADGSRQRRLTNNEFGDSDPSWAPDRRRIAFATGRHANPPDDLNFEIYVINADGGGERRITHSPNVFDADPTWSPDGKNIAFRRVDWRRGDDENELSEIYVMNADGRGLRRLTNNAVEDSFPAWSPDGKKIAFTSARDGQREIYMMNPDGSGQRRLKRSRFDSLLPAWSPDGKKIAYMEGTGDFTATIYAMNADGSVPRRVVRGQGQSPTWSPDGRRIAFADFNQGNWQIYVVNTDGSGLRRLTSKGGNVEPAWQPPPRAKRVR